MSGERFGRDMRRVVRAHERLERLYADRRLERQQAGSDLRTLLTHLIWIEEVEGLTGDWGERVYELMPDHRIRMTIRSDCPRYQPPGDEPACPVPAPRKPECGREASVSFRTTDPATGHWQMAAYCRTHEREGRAAYLAELRLRQTVKMPEPLPNTGGLGPSHSGVDWPTLYRWADPLWKPPAVGIVAADWPVLAKIHAHRVSLTALDGDGEDTGTDGAPPPRFEVVR